MPDVSSVGITGSLDARLRADIKVKLKASIKKYVSEFEYENTQPLDLLIPKERKIRSLVGGLETSMGTTVWEPIAKSLAQNNGFEILQEKILIPDPFPDVLASTLATLISLREKPGTWIPLTKCIENIRMICKKIDMNGISFIRPPAGTGVDVFFKKNGIEYAFDIKTVQPNVGSIKSFNKQLLEWYAYRICKDPNVNIECRIAYPYNPHSSNFWSYAPHNNGILKPSIEAVVENEFWDFLSGIENTFQLITEIFKELHNDGFGTELSKLIRKAVK